MKHLRDYLGKGILIEVKTEEEFEELCPLLNEIYRGWSPHNYKSYTDKSPNFFIILDKDVMDRPRDINFSTYSEVISASEFLRSQDQIINNYSIY